MIELTPEQNEALKAFHASLPDRGHHMSKPGLSPDSPTMLLSACAGEAARLHQYARILETVTDPEIARRYDLPEGTLHDLAWDLDDDLDRLETALALLADIFG